MRSGRRAGVGAAAVISRICAASSPRCSWVGRTFPGQLTDRSQRFRIAEIIREKLTFELVRSALWHCGRDRASAEADGRRLDAAIWVDRDGQKPIVIGAEGSRLKRVGRAARLESTSSRSPLSPHAVGQGARGLGGQRARAAAAGIGMSRSSQRVQLTRAYVLHQRPFRDSSLIVEVFAREYGRMTLFARAARGPRSRFAALQPFQALLLSWSGRGEAPQLTAAESADRRAPMGRARLAAAACRGAAAERVLSQRAVADAHDAPRSASRVV